MGSPVGLRVRVVVQGELGPTWSAMFADMAVEPSVDGRTLIVGKLPDQAALYGLLATIRDLGLSLVCAEARADSGADSEASAPAGSLHPG